MVDYWKRKVENIVRLMQCQRPTIKACKHYYKNNAKQSSNQII